MASKIITRKRCPKCNKPLVKLPWHKDAKSGDIDIYIVTCDNIWCLLYRNPMVVEKTDKDII